MDSSPEYSTIKSHMDDINQRIAPSEVSTYASELLQDGLISSPGCGNAIAVTGISPRDKIASLTFEAMEKIKISPELFGKLVAILKKRDSEFASRLLRQCQELESVKLTPGVWQQYTSSATLSVEQDHSPLTVYVDKLKRVYQTPPTTWLSLPNCKHIKLAMTNEKGTRCTREPDKLIEHRVKGEVEPLMASKVPVDMDSIFNEGVFENVLKPLVILVEGAFGSGKSTLAYHYCQKWAQGNLGMFDLVALVYLRHPAVHSAGKELTLHQLLLLASDGEEDIVRHAAHQLVKDGLKCLLILDGWDEAPACIRAPPNPKHPPDNSFLGNLLRSVSSNTTILITSRPDSSVDLHNRPNVKRVEILGFTKEKIYEYFKESLSTQLSSTILEDECRKLKDHLANYPAIESSCYIPLNAAILTLLYLRRNRKLPTTHFEMFYGLLLCCIAREVNTRQQHCNLGSISSLNDLPRDLKKQVKHISILAYEGVMNNKFVFTQDELQNILPRSIWDRLISFLSPVLPIAATPAQQDLPAMGVLQKVQWAGVGNKTLSYNFVHLSIQEMLAAYRISQVAYSEQISVFRKLVSNPRFAAVLQFYAGLTKLTNRGVRNIITSELISLQNSDDPLGYSLTLSSIDDNRSSIFFLITFVRCFFEAQIKDQFLYTKIIQKLNGNISFNSITLNPLDCMCVGYFLAFVLKNSNSIHVNLSRCSIDDRLLDLLMGQLSKHAELYPGGVLHGITELNISQNEIGDTGIDRIVTALQTNTTLRKLNISHCSISVEGAKSIAISLSVNRSLNELNISGNYKIGDAGIAHIANALQTNTTLKKLDVSNCSQVLYRRRAEVGLLRLASLIEHSSLDCNLTSPWTNNNLTSLYVGGKNTTDDEVLSQLPACYSLEDLKLKWSCTDPVSTLKKIGNFVSKSRLNKLSLIIFKPNDKSCSAWARNLTVGGNDLILSLEDNHELQTLYLTFGIATYSEGYGSIEKLHSRWTCESLEKTAAIVNTARQSLPKILPLIEIQIMHRNPSSMQFTESDLKANHSRNHSFSAVAQATQ